MNVLLTHDVGSLSKPSWRVKALKNLALNENDLEEAKKWGKKLKIPDYENLERLLAKKTGFTLEEKKQIRIFSSLYGLRFLEEAGLDIVWDGEQNRIEMYEQPIVHIEGFRFQGHVRSFDNKYYKKASCEAQPKCLAPYHLEEYQEIASQARKPVKIPITGAYTLAEWSYDSFFAKGLTPGVPHVATKIEEARKEFLSALAKDVIYPNLKALCEAGAPYLQIDEPAAATKRDDGDHFVECIKSSVGDLAGKAFFSIHICYSEYQRLLPHLEELGGVIDEIHLEYANRDSWELGINSKQRPGYQLLPYLKDLPFKVGLGVLDIHTDSIESPELIRDRILHACDEIGDPNRILVAPDCGLRTRNWDIAYQKLSNMVIAKALAKKDLGF